MALNYHYNLRGQARFNRLLSQRDKRTREKWMKEQNDLKVNLIKRDVHNWKVNLNAGEQGEKLRYIGGVDISFDKYDKNVGISGLVVCDAQNDFNIVYDDYKFVKIKEPYIPSFLAFREVNPYVELINKLKVRKPHLVPQVILVDGNGILHTRGFGIASHLGVLVDIPTIGCAKTVFALKDEGITDDYVKDMYYKKLKKFGDYFPLRGFSDITWGYALRSTEYYDNPIIISIGHKVSNQTALEVAKMCCYYKEPEPIRLADLITRRLIKAYQDFKYYNPYKFWNLNLYYYKNYEYIHQNLYP